MLSELSVVNLLISKVTESILNIDQDFMQKEQTETVQCEQNR